MIHLLLQEYLSSPVGMEMDPRVAMYMKIKVKVHHRHTCRSCTWYMYPVFPYM